VANRIELRSALELREPTVVAFSDGREWEFPSDLRSDALMGFLERFAEELSSARLTLEGTKAFYQLVFADRYDEFLAGVSWSEAQSAAWALYLHYMGAKSPDKDQGSEGDDDSPPDLP